MKSLGILLTLSILLVSLGFAATTNDWNQQYQKCIDDFALYQQTLSGETTPDVISNKEHWVINCTTTAQSLLNNNKRISKDKKIELLHVIGWGYIYQKNDKEAVPYLLQLFYDYPDGKWTPNALIKLAQVHFRAQEYAKSLEYLTIQKDNFDTPELREQNDYLMRRLDYINLKPLIYSSVPSLRKRAIRQEILLSYLHGYTNNALSFMEEQIKKESSPEWRRWMILSMNPNMRRDSNNSFDNFWSYHSFDTSYSIYLQSKLWSDPDWKLLAEDCLDTLTTDSQIRVLSSYIGVLQNAAIVLSPPKQITTSYQKKLLKTINSATKEMLSKDTSIVRIQQIYPLARRIIANTSHSEKEIQSWQQVMEKMTKNTWYAENYYRSSYVGYPFLGNGEFRDKFLKEQIIFNPTFMREFIYSNFTSQNSRWKPDLATLARSGHPEAFKHIMPRMWDSDFGKYQALAILYPWLKSYEKDIAKKYLDQENLQPKTDEEILGPNPAWKIFCQPFYPVDKILIQNPE